MLLQRAFLPLLGWGIEVHAHYWQDLLLEVESDLSFCLLMFVCVMYILIDVIPYIFKTELLEMAHVIIPDEFPSGPLQAAVL